MAARLHQHSRARIHQQHGGVGGACPCDHVARVLLVTRRVGHNTFSLVCAEESISHINGYALFTFRGKTVHQQRKVNLLALCSVLVGFFFQRRHLIFKQQMTFPKQATYERALTIIHAAARNKTQQTNFALAI